jgi:hypothetical protein
MKVFDLFFDRFPAVMADSPELVLNADGTQISSKTVYEVLVTDRRLSLTEKLPPLPHFTPTITSTAEAKLSISTDGHYSWQSNTASRSSTVWRIYLLLKCHSRMDDGNGLFEVDSQLLAWIRLIQGAIPPRLRQMRFLPLVDGHSSRRNFDAMPLLENNEVGVVIIPSH